MNDLTMVTWFTLPAAWALVAVGWAFLAISLSKGERGENDTDSLAIGIAILTVAVLLIFTGIVISVVDLIRYAS